MSWHVMRMTWEYMPTPQVGWSHVHVIWCLMTWTAMSWHAPKLSMHCWCHYEDIFPKMTSSVHVICMWYWPQNCAYIADVMAKTFSQKWRRQGMLFACYIGPKIEQALLMSWRRHFPKNDVFRACYWILTRDGAGINVLTLGQISNYYK